MRYIPLLLMVVYADSGAVGSSDWQLFFLRPLEFLFFGRAREHPKAPMASDRSRPTNAATITLMLQII